MNVLTQEDKDILLELTSSVKGISEEEFLAIANRIAPERFEKGIHIYDGDSPGPDNRFRPGAA